jgi:hypothetical protein
MPRKKLSTYVWCQNKGMREPKEFKICYETKSTLLLKVELFIILTGSELD